MARIRSSSHEVTTNFCGNCGVILAKSYAIFDKCPKCKETIEAWLDKDYAARAAKIIQENTYSWSVVAMNKVMHTVVSVKYHGKINRYEGLSRPSTVFFEIRQDFYLKNMIILLKLFTCLIYRII